MNKNKSLLISLSIFCALQWRCSLPTLDDVTPPTVLIIYPYEGSVLSGTVNISIESNDDKEIIKVWYYLDGNLREYASVSNPKFQLNITPLADDRKHILVAAARDKAGNTGYSTSISVTFSESDDVTPPVVQILNPLNGQTVQDTVHVVASASDDRIVREVAFFIDGDSVLSDLIYPYEYFWSVVDFADSSEHTVFAKAYDGSNNWSVSTLITVHVDLSLDKTPPTVQLIYPVVGQILSGEVAVKVDAIDDKQLQRVEFYIDGVLESTIYTDTNSSPFAFLWDTSPYEANSQHILFFKAFDMAGNQSVNTPITFTIGSADLVPPVAQLIYPVVGEVLSGQVEVIVYATDDRLLDRVEFFTDGNLESTVQATPTSSTFNFLWNMTSYVPNSQHTLFFKAVDASGNQSVNTPITFTVGTVDQEPPIVTLLYPVDGDTLSGSVNVTVNVFDNIGVVKVDFFIDGGSNGAPNITLTDPPWIYLWNTSGLVDGHLHSLYIKAYDAAGNIGTSGPTGFPIK